MANQKYSIDVDARDGFSGTFARLKGAMTGVEGAASKLRNVLGTLGVAFSVGAAVAWAKGITDAAAALDDLADSTGSSVEDLSRLQNQMRISGVDASTFGALMNKLAVGMAGVDEESSKAGEALALLGITTKDPAQGMQDLANKLNTYADGANKAALVQAIFGKGNVAAAGALKDLARETDAAATSTTEFAGKAEEFQKTVNRAKIATEDWAISILEKLIPAYTRFLELTRRGGGAGFFAALGITPEDEADFPRAIERTRQSLQTLYEMRESLSRPRVTNTINNFLFGDLSNVESQIRVAEQRMAALQNIEADVARKIRDMTQGGDTRPDAPELPGKGAGGAAAKVSAFQREMEAAMKALALASAEAANGVDKLTAAERKLIELEASPVWRTFSQTQREKLTSVLQATVAEEKRLQAAEQAVKSAEKEANAVEKLRDIENARTDERQKADEAHEKALETIQQETDLLLVQAVTLGADERMREKILATMEATVKIQAALDRGETDIVEALKTQLDARHALIDATADQREATERSSSAEKAAAKLIEDQQRAAEKLGDTITDALMRAFESGKDFGKSFADSLKNIFKSMVLRPSIEFLIRGALGGLGLGVPGLANAGGVGGFNLGSLFGGFGSGGIFGSGGFANSFALGGIGQALGLSAPGLDTAGGPALTGFGSALGSILPFAGLALPLLAGLFEKEPSPVRGRFQVGGGGFEDNAFIRSRFGDLGFADADTEQFSGEAAKAFTTIIGNVLDGVASQLDQAQIDRVAAKLGSTVFDAIEGTFTTEEFLKQYGGGVLKTALTPAFEELGAEFGTLFSAFDGSIEEITAYANKLLQVNALLKTADVGLRSIFGGLSAQNVLDLADAFGSLQNALEATAFFLDRFYTDAEKLARNTETLTAQFEGLGLTLPDTREAFREIVESLDLTTTSGQEMYRALLVLAPALDAILPPLEAITDAVDDLGDTLTEAADHMSEAMLTIQGLIEAGGATGASRLQATLSLIEELYEAPGEALQAQFNYVKLAIDNITAQLQAGVGDQYALIAQQDQFRAASDTIFRRLNLFNSLVQKEGAEAAAKLFSEYEKYVELKGLFAGYTEDLLVIEAAYQKRREEILSEGTQNGLDALDNALHEWLSGLLLSETLSPLQPMERLAEAQRQFDAAIASGVGSQIASAGNALLTLGRDLFASGSQYNALFADVTTRSGGVLAQQFGIDDEQWRGDVISLLIQIRDRTAEQTAAVVIETAKQTAQITSTLQETATTTRN